MTATEAQVDAAAQALFYGSLASGGTVLWDGMREDTKSFWRDRGRHIAEAVVTADAENEDARDALRFVYDFYTVGGNGEGWTTAMVLAVLTVALGEDPDDEDKQWARNVMGEAWVERALNPAHIVEVKS